MQWWFWFSLILWQHRSYFRRRQWHPTPVVLPGKSHGRRSLVGCSPWVHAESDTTDQLHFHFSLPCIGEGNGSPLQCSCLENPRDREAWQAAVYVVAQSAWLKRLNSSSSSRNYFPKVKTFCPWDSSLFKGKVRISRYSQEGGHFLERPKVGCLEKLMFWGFVGHVWTCHIHFFLNRFN